MYDAVTGLTSCQDGNTNMIGQGAILADDMGLGKTIQAIALIWTLLRQSPYFGAGPLIKRALVVCPASLIHNWKKEFDKWLGPDKIKVCVLDGSKTTDPKVLCASAYHEVIVLGYERLRIDADVLSKAAPPVGLIVCDEGHRLKTSETKTVHALAKLHTPKRVILSGTPIQNDLGEFHAVADWANPGLLGDYPKFKRCALTLTASQVILWLMNMLAGRMRCPSFGRESSIARRTTRFWATIAIARYVLSTLPKRLTSNLLI